MAGLKVNFSAQETESEARSFEPLPTGEYYARITDITMRESQSEKNFGKPYWAVELTVQDGKFENRKLWANVMLFDGALYSLAQLCKATGFESVLQTGIVPDADDLISKEVILVVKKQRDTYAENRDGDGEPQWKNEVKGFKTYGGASPSAKAKTKAGAGASTGSLLP